MLPARDASEKEMSGCLKVEVRNAVSVLQLAGDLSKPEDFVLYDKLQSFPC